MKKKYVYLILVPVILIMFFACKSEEKIISKISENQKAIKETQLENENLNVKANIECEKTQISCGDEIELVFNLKTNENIKEYVNVYKAKIDYDKGIFEEITVKDFVVCNSWSNLKYNQETAEFIIVNLNEISQNESVVKIKLKAKTNIKDSKNTTIKISNIETANWNTKEDIKVYTVSGKEQETIELNIQQKNNVNNTSNNNSSNASNSNGIENIEMPKEDENISDTKEIGEKKGILPNLGKNSKTIFTILIIICVIIMLISFIKLKKIEIKSKKLFSILFGVILTGTLLSNSYANSEPRDKGDINKDTQINIADVEILENHLVNIEIISDEDSLYIADINDDEKISIVDLSMLIKLTKKQDVDIKEDTNKDTENDDSSIVEGKNTKTAQEAIDEMKIGWNLGNTLDSCNYKKQYLGEEKAVMYYETLWGNPQTTKEMINEVKKAGFESIRIPVTYYDHIHQDGTIDEKWLKRVEEVVNYVLDNDMYCILDVHHDAGLYQNGSWIVADADKYEENAQKLSKLWIQIANRFKDYNYKLVFEGINEIVDTDKDYNWVTGTKDTVNVNKLNQVFIDTVRQTGGKNKDRFLVVTTFGAVTDEHKLSNFTMPKDDVKNKIILALHDYTSSEKGLDNMFARIKKYCIDKNVPVILDEFGTMAKSASEEQRAKIANYYVLNAKKLGITCFWWDNGQGKEYMLLNRRALTWEYPKVKDLIISASKYGN